MTRTRPAAVILFCTLLIFFSANVAPAGQTWMTWNTRSGLPSNNLTCLAIVKGKMAVGSDKGIGIFCENYSGWFNLADYNEKLTDLAVRSIDFDDYGTLWAATPNGLFAIDLEKFPEQTPEIRVFDTQNGLSTIDVEVVQVHENKIYVGCFGGWLFASPISPGSTVSAFSPVNSQNLANDDANKFLSVGITALAMNYPGGGIYSTKGQGLLRAATGENLVGSDELFSDWVNDFWAFEEGKSNRIIAVTQNQMNLIKNNQPVGRNTLPIKDAWISCLTTAPDDETDEYKRDKPKGFLNLETFIAKRVLYVGTRGQGLWVFNDGRWNNLTSRDSPLPSDNINKVYYLPGPRKLAILSEGGLTMLGTDEDSQFDIFETSGSEPYWAKTFWPFMQMWGPYVYGYPSQKCYPIEPYISYGKIIRGKDIWIKHDKGISRFIFPVAPFIGVMQYRFHLGGRCEAKTNDPTKDLTIEDNSTTADRPPTAPGEELWHHYCLEQPTDYSLAPLSDIWVSLDMKTMVGPDQEVLIDASSPEEPTPETISSALSQYAANSDNASATGTAVIRVGENRFDTRGHQLFTVASLHQECPLHAIPSANITDMTLDLSERNWVIFDHNKLACLDNRIGETVPDPTVNDWYEFASEQLPWEKDEQLLCIQRVGSAIYVSAENSGVFYLSTAHTTILKDLRPSEWVRIELPPDSEEPDQFKKIVAIAFWKSDKAELVAMLHKDSLSVFDGQTLKPVVVPKRNYTCMVADRDNKLWLGSLQGLLYLSPAGKVKTIFGKANDFNSERVVTMATAPDNAKYPYVLAVAVDQQAHENTGSFNFFRSSDSPPMLTRGADSPYRLRVINPAIGNAQIMLYDGEKWEPMFRPGVISMMFDQSFLWISTSSRVMRLYMPTVVQSY